MIEAVSAQDASLLTTEEMVEKYEKLTETQKLSLEVQFVFWKLFNFFPDIHFFVKGLLTCW